MQGCLGRSSASAAATLAAIMNSSISRWLSSALAELDAVDRRRGIDDDPSFRQVELEHAALRARLQQRPVGAVEQAR